MLLNIENINKNSMGNRFVFEIFSYASFSTSKENGICSFLPVKKKRLDSSSKKTNYNVGFTPPPHYFPKMQIEYLFVFLSRSL